MTNPDPKRKTNVFTKVGRAGAKGVSDGISEVVKWIFVTAVVGGLSLLGIKIISPDNKPVVPTAVPSIQSQVNTSDTSNGCLGHPGSSLLFVGDYKVTGWAAHYVDYVSQSELQIGWFPDPTDIYNPSWEETINPLSYPVNEWENKVHPFNNIYYGGYSFCRTNDGKLYYSADQ